jgi:hypothetical protein
LRAYARSPATLPLALGLVNAGDARWLLQKLSLSQDALLLSRPGPAAADLVNYVLALLRWECEWVDITRDTTEGDLKQRRGVLNGASVFEDGPAVRAALGE